MEEKPASAEEIIETPAMEQPPTEPPAPSFREKLKIHKFKIIGGIFGILVFAGAVFGAYKFGQRQAQPAAQPTPTPEVVATPTPDPTANWKTYIDTVYNYSIKYPPDWYHRPTPTEGFGGVATFANYDPEEASKEVGRPVPEDKIKIQIGVSIHSLKSGQTLREWLDEKEKEEEGMSQLEVISYSEIIIGENIEAIQKTITIGGASIQTIYFTRDSEVYFISGSSSSLTTFSSTFNLMLSTFRFLEVSETQNWKTYTNTRDGYSIKYPKEWFLEEGVGLVKFYNQDSNIHKFERTRETSPGVLDYPKEDFIFDINVIDNVIPGPDLAQKSTIEIGELDGAKGILTGGEGEKILMGYVIKDGKTYMFYGRPADSNYKDDFNLMLSTFSFLE